MESDNIKVGDTLKIPSNSTYIGDSYFTYTVKKGDSLYSIAKLYNTSVNELIRLNNLKTINLSIGDKLLLPDSLKKTLPVTYTTYTVKKGDTIYSISRDNNISVNTLLKDNNKSSNIISVGEVLKIRKDSVLECFGYTSYVVKKGDTIYSIARKYNTTVDDILNKNNLNSNNLIVGEEIIIWK